MFGFRQKKLMCEPPAVPLKIKEVIRSKPLMMYDGSCGFCQRSIEKWQKITGDVIQYIPYQFFDVDERSGRLKDFPEISVKDCEQSVQLVLPGGQHSQGAEAVFRVWRASGRRRILFWFYISIPGFKFISEFMYRFVARHRFWF